MSIKELFEILLSENPRVALLSNEDKLFELIPELKICKGFEQNNKWHIYDVYEHTLHVVDYAPKTLILRLTALFHDIGKPLVYKEDENKVGHFYDHFKESKRIFDRFAKKYNIDEITSYYISNLIYYHDISVSKLDDLNLKKLYDILGYFGISILYEFKKADLLAQNKDYHYILNDYDKEKIKILSKYKMGGKNDNTLG